MEELLRMATFLRDFVKNNTTSAERARVIRNRIRGYRELLIIDNIKKKVCVGHIANLFFLPKRKE